MRRAVIQERPRLTLLPSIFFLSTSQAVFHSLEPSLPPPILSPLWALLLLSPDTRPCSQTHYNPRPVLTFRTCLGS